MFYSTKSACFVLFCNIPLQHLPSVALWMTCAVVNRLGWPFVTLVFAKRHWVSQMPVGDQRFWYQGAFGHVMALEELCVAVPVQSSRPCCLRLILMLDPQWEDGDLVHFGISEIGCSPTGEHLLFFSLKNTAGTSLYKLIWKPIAWFY